METPAHGIFSCHDGTAFPAQWADRLRALDALYRAMNREAGCTLRVVSAYRTPAWNRRVGGARNSQHVQGRALDLAPPRGVSVARVYKAALRVNPKGGIGRYRLFVHVDLGGKRRW